jgi:hypothetical protein
LVVCGNLRGSSIQAGDLCPSRDPAFAQARALLLEQGALLTILVIIFLPFSLSLAKKKKKKSSLSLS